MPQVSDAQLAAFHSTHYRVTDADGEFTLRIGQASTRLRGLHEHHQAACSAYLTAWNPQGQESSHAFNAHNQSELLGELQRGGYPVLFGAGTNPQTGWTEDSMLAIGLTREKAAELGRRYRQLAIVVCTADAVPELLLLA